MIPVFLEIENINSFTEAQSIDFLKLSKDRLFCICGDTGAGKTTVLDAIIIALYGIDRGNDGSRSKKEDYINVKADRASVAFAFEFGGKTYRVERIFARNGGNKAYLYENETLVGQGAEKVDALVEEILGLTRAEFTQVIILQQGAFSKFLTAGKTERTRTVEKLFKLEKYDLHKKVNAKKIELDNRLAELNGRLEMLGGVTEKTVADLKRQGKDYLKAADELRGKEQTAETKRKATAEAKQKYDDYLKNKAQAERLKTAFETATENYRAAIATPIETLEQTATDSETAARDAGAKLETFLRQKKARETAIELTAERDKLRDAYKAAIAEEKDLQTQGKQTEQTLAEKKDELTALQAQIDTASAALGLSTADGFAALGNVCAGAAARLKTENEAYEKNEKARAEAKKQLDELLVERDAIETQAEIAAAKEKAATDNLETARRNDSAAAVRKGLHKGDVCPVCGGVFDGAAHDGAGCDLKQAEEEAKKASDAAKAFTTQRAKLDERVVALEKKLGETLDKPADFAPYLALQSLCLTADYAEKAVAAAEKAHGEIAGKLQTLGEKMNGQRDVGVAVGKNIDRATVEAGDCAQLNKTELEERQKRLEDEKEKAETEASAAREKARVAGAESKRLEAEKAKAEGEYNAALRLVTEVPAVTDEDVQAAEQAVQTLSEDRERVIKAQAETQTQLVESEKKLAQKKTLSAEKKTLDESVALHSELVKLLKDGALVKYVAEEYIRAFTAAASVRLEKLSSGKYSLQYENGEYSICDHLNGDARRRVVTLSGGETFLASLSLAAAISDAISHGGGYGCFFLDEGFGTLDENKLEQVYDALLTLSRDTLVGIVTHSDRLMEKIPAHVTVLPAAGEYGSVIV